jgi:hypothetical protein
MVLIGRGARLTDAAIRWLRANDIAAIYVEQEGAEGIQADEVISPEMRIRCEKAVSQAMHIAFRKERKRVVSLLTDALSLRLPRTRKTLPRVA